MARWIRFEHAGQTGFGTLEGDTITVHEGDLFAGPAATGETGTRARVRFQQSRTVE